VILKQYSSNGLPHRSRCALNFFLSVIQRDPGSGPSSETHQTQVSAEIMSKFSFTDYVTFDILGLEAKVELKRSIITPADSRHDAPDGAAGAPRDRRKGPDEVPASQRAWNQAPCQPFSDLSPPRGHRTRSDPSQLVPTTSGSKLPDITPGIDITRTLPDITRPPCGLPGNCTAIPSGNSSQQNQVPPWSTPFLV